jgi:hypothetical protein
MNEKPDPDAIKETLRRAVAGAGMPELSPEVEDAIDKLAEALAYRSGDAESEG